MYRTVMIAAFLLVSGLLQAAVAAESRTAEENKGLTVDDLGRGLKSAARNVEKEIPKAGSAIGSVFKKITAKGSEKPASQRPTK